MSYIPGRSSHKKYGSIAVQSKPIVFFFISRIVFSELILTFLIHFIRIFENQVFNGSSIYFRFHENMVNQYKKKIYIYIYITYKELLGIVLNPKRTAYIQFASTSQFFKLTVSPNLALQNVTEAFPEMYTSMVAAKAAR